MVAVRSRKFQFQFQFGLMLATVFSLSTLPAAGQSYTPEQQQACTPDAMRLCGDYVPDVERITACMIQKKSQLSPQCRAHFRPETPPEAGPTNTTGQPLRIKPLTPRKPVAAKAKKPKKPANPDAT